MAKLITKFKYIRPMDRKSVGGYAKYIATREGVDKVDDTFKLEPATKKQQKLIGKILHDFPDSAIMLEYEDYLKEPTVGNASEFISRSLEDNAVEVMESKTYADYIATRPRAQRFGSHGLFTDDGVRVKLGEVSKELNEYEGNVWTVILSLRREDAERLGFNTGERWRDMLRTQTEAIAKNFKLPMEDLKWYAAFHNEGHHPHVHLIAYSTNAKEGFLTKQGMEKIRSALAQEIFRQDLVSVYERQTAHRDELRRASREKVAGLVQQINWGSCENPQVEQLLRELANRLSNVKGKKVYGYLRPELKALVNQIVDELAKDEHITALYDLWYQDKQAARNVYDERPLERVPLSENPDFKPVRNAVVRAALELEQEQSEVQRPAYTPPLLPMATRLLRQVGQIFAHQFNLDPPVARLVDKKLRQKIAEKKLAHGQKLEM